MADTETGSAERGDGRLPRRSLLRIALPVVLLLVWVAIGAFAGPLAGKLSDVVTNDNASFLPASSESTKVQVEQQAFSDSNALPAVIVAQRDSGITAADQQFLADALRSIATVPHVAGPDLLSS